MRFAASYIICVALLLELPVGYCGDAPPSRFSSTHITVDEWRMFLAEVTGTSGVRCRDVLTNQLQCDSKSQATIWIFTRAGHPAHPAVTRAILRASGSQLGIDRTGHYAGSESAFRAWMSQFVDLDQRSVNEWSRAVRR
jgi:hypothetical protein